MEVDFISHSFRFSLSVLFFLWFFSLLACVLFMALWRNHCDGGEKESDRPLTRQRERAHKHRMIGVHTVHTNERGNTEYRENQRKKNNNNNNILNEKYLCTVCVGIPNIPFEYVYVRWSSPYLCMRKTVYHVHRCECESAYSTWCGCVYLSLLQFENAWTRQRQHQPNRPCLSLSFSLYFSSFRLFVIVASNVI